MLEGCEGEFQWKKRSRFVGAFSYNVDKALEELILLKELFTVLLKSLRKKLP